MENIIFIVPFFLDKDLKITNYNNISRKNPQSLNINCHILTLPVVHSDERQRFSARNPKLVIVEDIRN